MLVYFGESITVQVRGQTWREEKCQHCRGRFHYPLQVTATGTAINPFFLDTYGSPRRAEDDARSQLDHALKRAVLPVPCPHCTKYQDYMIPALRAKRLLWMLSVAHLLLGLGAVTGVLGLFVAMDLLTADRSGLNIPAVAAVFGALVAPLAAGLGLWRARRWRLTAYDPNAETYTTERRRRAAERALTPEEFARLQIPTTPPGLAQLGPPPRSRQLVGSACVRCGQRVSNELDSRFCPGCGWPVHDRCAIPAAGGCPHCGAGATTAAPRDPAEPGAESGHG